MNRKALVLTLVLALAVLLCGALAVGGGAEDPLVSLSYLKSTYLPSLLSQAKSAAANSAGQEASFTESRVKYGDRCALEAGSTLVHLAGTVLLTQGTAIDVTDGAEISAGSVLLPDHRYITAENTTAVYTVSSDTAVLSVQGQYQYTYSSATDYNALADGLKRMGLFQGKSLSTGSGFDLEAVPTRIEGLVMFIRMLGEEEEALAYTGSHPFSDIPKDYWGYAYVAYAYAKGYTNGTDADCPMFSPNDTIDARQYMTFVLRALSYRDSAGDFSWDTALSFAREEGLLTAGEYSRLSTGVFYRAQVAYLSYYALSMSPKGSASTLLDRLIQDGAVDSAIANTVLSQMPNNRIS